MEKKLVKVRSSLRNVFTMNSQSMEKGPLKVAVLGATGPTGQHLVKQALDRGWEVRALVRDTDKMASQVQHDKLQILKVDMCSADSLAGQLTGVDAIVSSLGGKAGIWKECSLYTDTLPPIISAMKQAGVGRIVCVTCWGTKDEEGMPWVISWFLKPTFLRNVLADMARMEDYITSSEDCKAVTYTVVRPPGLTNTPVTEKEVLTREGYFVPNASNSLSRADLARFMLDCLSTEAFHNKMVAIGV